VAVAYATGHGGGGVATATAGLMVNPNVEVASFRTLIENEQSASVFEPRKNSFKSWLKLP